MIVIVANASGRRTTTGFRAAGVGVAIAAGVAGTGRPVQLVGKVGEGPDGDAILLSLAAAGVGHVAVLRDVAPAHVEIDDRAADGPEESVDQLADRDADDAARPPDTSPVEVQDGP